MTNLYSRYGKRLLDVFAAVVLGAFLMPVFAVLVVLVWLRMGYPVFFRQERAGQHGKPFQIVKFRTMVHAVDESGCPLPDGERLSRFGRTLRQSSLDELPELWNVLKGDMSLVGPRPLPLRYLPRYGVRHRSRHSVRPGITGLAQVSGRNALGWENRFDLDVQYASSISLWTDLQIIFRTITCVLLRRGISADGHATMPEYFGSAVLPTGAGAADPVPGPSHPAAPAATASWPAYDAEEIAAALAVLRSGRVNYWSGDEGRAFEAEYAKALGLKHAIAVANGTVALELALLALGIGNGDEVIVPSRTFVATASAVVARGGIPIIADIDTASQCITPESVQAVLTERTKAIIVVHLGGWPARMDALCDFAKKHGLLVIEDCAQAHGARLKGRPVGTWGEISAFSFCTDKIISTGGEGGLVAMNDDHLWDVAWRYKDHGKNPVLAHERSASGAFRYLHDSFGTNWRMTEFQAALGRAQLRRLESTVATRRCNAAFLRDQLSGCVGLTFPTPAADEFVSYYRLYGFTQPAHLGPDWSRDRIVASLRSRGVDVGSGSTAEIYKEGALRALYPSLEHPNARRLQETSIAFRVDPTVTEQCLRQTVQAVQEVFAAATVRASYAVPRAA